MNFDSRVTILISDNRSIFVRRFLFPGYLIFSVCFYSYRFLYGMGSPLTTAYDSDAPAWLRVSKDLIWLGVLVAALAFSSEESRQLARQNRQAHAAFFQTLVVLIGVFVFMGIIHLFYHQSPLNTFLYWIRYPLEYVPMAFFMPIFVFRWRPLVPLLLGLGWVSVAFLAIEMFSGKPTGFYGRYGSILGSPNDYGMLCALFVLSLLVCARTWSHWLLMAFTLCGLVMALSRSASAGLLAGISSLLYLRRGRVGALIGVVLLICLTGLLFWKFPDFLALEQVKYGLAHFGVTELDNSAISRLNEFQVFETRFGDFEFAPLLFGTDYFHIESWYLALVVRTGVLGLLLWLAVMGATCVRGWRYRNASRVHAVATANLICICVASGFIPYPDVFPTNLYLWMAVGVIWMPVVPEDSLPLAVVCGRSPLPREAAELGGVAEEEYRGRGTS